MGGRRTGSEPGKVGGDGDAKNSRDRSPEGEDPPPADESQDGTPPTGPPPSAISSEQSSPWTSSDDGHPPPPPYAMATYKNTHVPVYNLPHLLGAERVHRLQAQVPMFDEHEILVVKSKRPTVKLQMGMWKLMGYLAG